MSYFDVLKCGWAIGVYDCRGLGCYQHPWLAVCRETRSVVGCYNRAEARRTLREIRADMRLSDTGALQ